MFALTTWEWLQTWYFWSIVIFCIIIFTALVLVEKRDRKERAACPTCYSTRKKDRYEVRYWLSDYVYHDSPCEDFWHNKKRREP